MDTRLIKTFLGHDISDNALTLFNSIYIEATRSDLTYAEEIKYIYEALNTDDYLASLPAKLVDKIAIEELRYVINKFLNCK